MFTLPPERLAAIRDTAEQAMQDNITFYTIDVQRDVYGNETIVSGVANTYPCLMAAMNGKDEEVVWVHSTDGFIKTRTVKCLLPYDAEVDSSYVAVVSGTNQRWRVVWENSHITDNYRVYVKAFLTADDPLTTYPDHIRKNR
jgi:hypothetical protein